MPKRGECNPQQAPDFWIFRIILWFGIIFSGVYIYYVKNIPTVESNFVLLVFPVMFALLRLITRGQYKKYRWSDPGVFDLRFGQMFILLALGLFLEGMLYLGISANILGIRPNLYYAAVLMAIMGSYFCMRIVWPMICKPVRA